jgi:hypothetical protein
VLLESRTETQDTKAFQEGIFISVLEVVQQVHIQRLSSKAENKRVSPYIPLQASYRSKMQNLTHIWLHVTLLATSPPAQMWPPSCLHFLSFLSLLCHPLPTATLSEHGLACFLFFLALLPATLADMVSKTPFCYYSFSSPYC